MTEAVESVPTLRPSYKGASYRSSPPVNRMQSPFVEGAGQDERLEGETAKEEETTLYGKEMSPEEGGDRATNPSMFSGEARGRP